MKYVSSLFCMMLVFCVAAQAATPKKSSRGKSTGSLPINAETLKRVLKGTWQNPPDRSAKQATAMVYSFDGNLNQTFQGVAVEDAGVLSFPGGAGPLRFLENEDTGLKEPLEGPVLEVPVKSGSTGLPVRWLLLAVKEKSIDYMELGANASSKRSLTKINDEVIENKEEKPAPAPPPPAPPARAAAEKADPGKPGPGDVWLLRYVFAADVSKAEAVQVRVDKGMSLDEAAGKVGESASAARWYQPGALQKTVEDVLSTLKEGAHTVVKTEDGAFFLMLMKKNAPQ